MFELLYCVVLNSSLFLTSFKGFYKESVNEIRQKNLTIIPYNIVAHWLSKTLRGSFYHLITQSGLFKAPSEEKNKTLVLIKPHLSLEEKTIWAKNSTLKLWDRLPLAEDIHPTQDPTITHILMQNHKRLQPSCFCRYWAKL